jgi:hypothetical protein
LLAGVALSSVPGCTKFASELDRPVEDDVSGSALQPPLRDWSCVPEMPPAVLTANTSRPLTYTLGVTNLVTSVPVANAQVRACFRADVGCSNPIGAPLVTRADGTVSITLFEGFNGFLEIVAEGLLPTIAFFPSAWSAELLPYMEQLPVLVLPAEALLGLATSARVQLDPTGGLVSMYTYDCMGPFAPGVRLEIDTAAALPYAFVDALPVLGQDVTSESGIVGFVNVPPGIVVVTAFPDDGQQALSVDTMLVRTGWVTAGRLIPNFAR